MDKNDLLVMAIVEGGVVQDVIVQDSNGKQISNYLLIIKDFDSMQNDIFPYSFWKDILDNVPYGTPMFKETVKDMGCERCGCVLDDHGFCTDKACPFSEHMQWCYKGWSENSHESMHVQNMKNAGLNSECNCDS